MQPIFCWKCSAAVGLGVGVATGSVLKTVRALGSDWERWRGAAVLAGLPLNSWVRRALDDRAALEEALERERLRRVGG